MSQLLFLELNEINFDHIRIYVDRGLLPNFSHLIEQHGVSETESEKRYEELEPWIQWVTAHTGKTLAEHNIFRLGDITAYDIPQIWEQLEEKGLKVGAISPINAKNRTKDAAFFVPDPWTDTPVSGPPLLKAMSNAVSQAVNDNAKSRIAAKSVLALLAGAAVNARPANYTGYLRLFGNARKKPWAKAMFLDLLLADTFINQTKKKRPDFASLFLNAGAHIQHHYMFSAAAYDGPMKNPDWYIGDGLDPVLEIYALYDRILGQITAAFPKARIMIATGLHQDPYPELTFYWRLANHSAFLRKLSAPFASIEPRMSRDFLVDCDSTNDADKTAQILAGAEDQNGVKLFDVDNRGTDLFVMLTYPHDIPDEFQFKVGNHSYADLRKDVAFVAIKNGQHNGIGYFVDTGVPKDAQETGFPLTQIPGKILNAFGV